MMLVNFLMHGRWYIYRWLLDAANLGVGKMLSGHVFIEIRFDEALIV